VTPQRKEVEKINFLFFIGLNLAFESKKQNTKPFIYIQSIAIQKNSFLKTQII
jgi:hypothetical protein